LKPKVALEALGNEATIAELAAEYRGDVSGIALCFVASNAKAAARSSCS
jgi:hypothetical protein